MNFTKIFQKYQESDKGKSKVLMKTPATTILFS